MDSKVRCHGHAPRRTTLATLAALYHASEQSITDQLREQGCAKEIENSEDIDTLSLFKKLDRYQQTIFDLSGDDKWAIATPAIISKIADLPREIVCEPAYLSRLSPTVVINGQNTWRYQELMEALLSDPRRAKQWDFCGDLGLSQSQRSWLAVNGALPMAFLKAHAMPGWSWLYIENSRCMQEIDSFRKQGMPDLGPGLLVDMDDIKLRHGISKKEMLDLMLRDQMMCPLRDSAGNTGWPRDYVQEIADSKSVWRAGGKLVNRAGDDGVELAWEEFFLASPDTAWKAHNEWLFRGFSA